MTNDSITIASVEGWRDPCFSWDISLVGGGGVWWAVAGCSVVAGLEKVNFKRRNIPGKTQVSLPLHPCCLAGACRSKTEGTAAPQFVIICLVG